MPEIRFKNRKSDQVELVSRATGDIERFLVDLSKMTAQEVGIVVATATVIRFELRQQNLFPDAALGVGAPLPEAQQAEIRATLSTTAIDHQRSRHPRAVGAMVWVHTLRAYHFPEVRILGRQMWHELERGFPNVFVAFAALEKTAGRALPLGTLQESRFIPIGMEPFEPIMRTSARGRQES